MATRFCQPAIGRGEPGPATFTIRSVKPRNPSVVAARPDTLSWTRAGISAKLKLTSAENTQERVELMSRFLYGRFLIFGILAALSFQSLSTRAADGPNAPYRNARLPVDERVKDLLSRMTLEEKIEQLSQKSAGGIEMKGDEVDPESLMKLFGDRSPGVLCVNFGDDLFQTARRLTAGQEYLRQHTRLGIPALTVNEALHGVLAKGATIYPQFIALGCTWNPSLAEKMGGANQQGGQPSRLEPSSDAHD